ncbi:YeeE/YedE thiosulfate transporter family protein [Clostridiaceae bacterium M8S5]|nr:YeeE/YedE thiosulfate transporter family protein [Clostridiaceae bacterium M8S5]
MPSNEMAKLIQERQNKSNKKKNQFFYGILFILISIIIFIFLLKKDNTMAICWIIGVCFGIVLRYSRFCFTAIFRDPIITGDTRLMRGLILALIVTTLGFTFIQGEYLSNNTINYNTIPGEVSSVGPHVILGAIIFGIGMVIAGGCASGVLMRIGEGHLLQIVVLVGFIIGALLGARDYSFWHKITKNLSKVIYFSEYLDYRVVTVIQIFVLVILYRYAIYYEKKRFKNYMF